MQFENPQEKTNVTTPKQVIEDKEEAIDIDKQQSSMIEENKHQAEPPEEEKDQDVEDSL